MCVCVCVCVCVYVCVCVHVCTCVYACVVSNRGLVIIDVSVDRWSLFRCALVSLKWHMDPSTVVFMDRWSSLGQFTLYSRTVSAVHLQLHLCFYRRTISQVLGAELHFSFYHRWFDVIFLVS